MHFVQYNNFIKSSKFLQHFKKFGKQNNIERLMVNSLMAQRRDKAFLKIKIMDNKRFNKSKCHIAYV